MLKLRTLSLLLIIASIISCEANIENKEQNKEFDSPQLPQKNQPNDSMVLPIAAKKDTTRKVQKSTLKSPLKPDTINLEQYLLNFGLVDIQQVVPGAMVDLKYSTTDNFVGIDMYGELEKAFCQPDVAEKLNKAYQYLQEEDSALTLLIFDAVRPVFVQQKMWDTLKMPIREKTKFLSNPRNHSIHNYGAAVDISLSTKEGQELDMGTPFDYIGVLAHPRQEQKLLKDGKLTQKQIENRQLLRKVMKKAGFFNIQTEWWHWNSCSRNTAKRRYKVVR